MECIPMFIHNRITLNEAYELVYGKGESISLIFPQIN